MKTILLAISILLFSLGCSLQSTKPVSYHIPAEFEQQESIWLSWKENGFLGGAPFYTTILEAISEIHRELKVTILYGPQMQYNKDQMEERIWSELLNRGIDTSRIQLFYNEKAFGAIQDPGPIFLRDNNGGLAVADFRYSHPDPRSEVIDRNVAKTLNLPIVSSEMISEGGAWQTNGKGTMLLVESVELDRNKTLSKEQIEEEYRRVLGVRKFIWLKAGLKDEEWGLLEDGRYGIGTGGHIDEFCRFVDSSTVLLTSIDPKDTIENMIQKISYERMEENYNKLLQSRTQDGKTLKIIRLPAGPVQTRKIAFSSLNDEEQTWFENVKSDSIEFYLTTGYMNFVIANDVVVTAGYWKEGLPAEWKERDAKAQAALSLAFPNRRIVQIDCMPLHHDGAGLHCHSRNQPETRNVTNQVSGR